MSKLFNPLANLGVKIINPALIATVAADAVAPIFNPLGGVSTSGSTVEDSLVSTSAITNSDVGVCPKCKKSMEKAVIANSDTVYFCGSCRVSSPLQDQ